MAGKSIYAKACLQDLDKQFAPIAKEFIETWETNKGTGLLLSGPNGAGKSYAAAAIINTLSQHIISGVRVGAAFMTSPLIYDRYYDISRDKHIDEYRGGQPFHQTLEDIDILVWNDLGKENRTGRYHGQVIYCFNRLLRHRIEHGLSTIFTTNLNLDPKTANWICDVYGQDFWSLLGEAAPLRYATIASDRRLSGYDDEASNVTRIKS